MPLEGAVVRQHIKINWLDRLDPIFDISFRQGHQQAYVPNGDAANYVINPATMMDRGYKFYTIQEAQAVLASGSPILKQMQQVFNENIVDGISFYAHELDADVAGALDDTDVTDGLTALDNYVEANPGTGWPYLMMTNLGDDIDEMPTITNMDTCLATFADAIGASERIGFLRVPRDPGGNLATMATDAKTKAEAINSPRIVLLAHDGDDADLDGAADSEAYLDAAAVGFIASLPVGGWEIFAKNPIGLPVARFSDADRLVLENGAPGVSGAITSTGGFQKAAFSMNNTTAGSFIDVQQTKDFLGFKLRQALWLRFKNYNKIPFTPRGFEILARAIEEVLVANGEDPGTQIGIVRRLDNNDLDYTITMPTLDQIPLAERVNRHLTPVNVRIGYTGSVLFITLNNVLEM